MKLKRMLSLLAVFCMVMTMVGSIMVPAVAAGDTVVITTADQLCAIAAGDMSADYELGADIDLTGKDYTPIGTPNAPFKGTFDGKYHKISGLKIEGAASCVGLFGVNAGTVRNITLAEDCSISGSSYVGAIAGRNNGIIEDCISDATVSYTAASGLSNKTYKLLSQNLCQWGDNALTSNGSYVDSTTYSRRPSMLQRIQNANPDLLCFQEVSFRNYNYNGKTITAWDTYLRNKLTDYTIYGTYRADNDTEGVTVGWKTAQFEQVEQGMFWLSENPDAPRSQQVKAWGAGCVRACTWVLLKDISTGQHLALYCTHFDHLADVPLPREKGALVVTAKMEDKKAELLAQYPDAMFIVTGDFNEEEDCAGYKNVDKGLGGWLDDARYAYQGEAIADLTYGDNINSVTDSDGIIDYIFTDSATIQVTDFKVLTDYYNNMRPSDHHGIYAEFSKANNNAIGGICGSNGGTLQRIIARGSAEGEGAKGVGSLIGSNSGFAECIYSTDAEGAIDHGRKQEIAQLPEEAALSVVLALNKHAQKGVFTILEEEYALVGGREMRVPVCLTVNGDDYAVYAGETYTAADFGIEGYSYFFNGELVEGDTFLIPEGGGVLNTVASVSTVEWEETGGEFAVESMKDWIYLWLHQDYFASRDITIHLLTDLDFSTATASQFTTMQDPAFSFNGHGFTIRNWGSEEEPKNQIGFFTVENGEGGMNFIKNVNFENCHLWDKETDGGAGTTLVYAVVHGNAGMEGLPAEFRMENVHVKNCSLGADSSEANAFLLSRYGVSGKEINVYLKNCSVKESVLDANNGDHKGFLIGKIRSNSQGNQANFYMEDCIVEGNTLENSNGFTGFAFGNIEATGVDAYLKNVAILNNTASGTKDGAIIGHMNKGGVVCEGVLMQGNTLNQSTRYVIASDGNAPVNVTTSAIYCDNTDLTGVVDGKSNGLTGGAEAVASGEAGYGINQLLEEPAFRWSLDEEGGYIPTKDASKQIRKVTIRGIGETATYLNGGSVFTLDAEGEYELIEGEATIENNQMVVNMDLLFAKEVTITDVTSAVSGGEYDIRSLSDFIYLYNHRDFFRNRNIIIHLRCDLDLSDPSAADFHGFDDPYFSFDGHGNTIENWGTEEAPAMAKALFFPVNGGGLNYIKNLKLENCHLTENTEDEYGDGNNALVYTSQQGNGGQAGLPSNLTLEGITIKGCSLTTENEASALLLGRYAPASGNHTVNIKNITVEDSVLDAGEMDHKGLLIGKPRSNNAGGRAVFNVEDCYLYNNEIVNAGDKNVGFVFGTAEGNAVTVNLNNIGIIGNKMTHSADGALIGYSDGGIVTAKNMLIAGNALTANKSYLIANKSGVGSVSLTDVYSDATALTGAVEGGSQSHIPNKSNMQAGLNCYTINRKLSTPSFYWGMAEGLPAPTTAANQTARLTLVDKESAYLADCYIDGGESITFTYESAYYEILSATGGAMEGDTFTMPEGGKDVTMKVIENFCAHLYKEENAEPIEGNQHKIPCENGCGVDKIIDCTFGDWVPEERQGEDFHARYCVCGQEEAVACSHTKISHTENTMTHIYSCPVCGNLGAEEECTLMVDGTNLPAIGEQGQVPSHCSKGCGNTEHTLQVMGGDVNNNSAVTMADVVLLLRYLSGSIEAGDLQAGAGNVYTQDGFGENFGINTADAIMILKYILG